MTVGKTHSGKTTFAKALEKELANSVVIDQDNQAEFLQTNYQSLLPKQGQNMIKYALTQTIVDYAVNQTKCHIILCNSNRNKRGRLNRLSYFRSVGFTTIIVNFDISEDTLYERVEKSQRNTRVLRTVSTFKDVLIRQQNETEKDDVIGPTASEADYLFIVNNSDEVPSIISEIINRVQR